MIPFIRHSGKCKIIGTETDQQRQRNGLTTKGQNKRILVGNGTGLHLNYGGDYDCMRCQNSDLYTKKSELYCE